TDNAGKTLDSSSGGEPLAFLVGRGQIIAGLESHLLAMKVGDKRRVLVPAKDACGDKDRANTTELAPDQMPAKHLKLGDRCAAGPSRNLWEHQCCCRLRRAWDRWPAHLRSAIISRRCDWRRSYS